MRTGLAVLILLTLVVLPATAHAQAWTAVYAGDYIPSNPPGVGHQLQQGDNNPFDWTLHSNDGAEVPVGAESYVNLQDPESASGRKWDEAFVVPSAGLNVSFPSGGTMVFRVRRKAGAVGDGEANVFTMDVNQIPMRLMIKDAGIDYLHGTLAPVPDMTAWNVIRVQFEPGPASMRIRTYLNGNINPIGDVTITNQTGGGTNLFKFGSTSLATGEYDMDWFVISDDGAYPPGTGPVLPAGFNEGFTGPTPTPELPTPTPTVTPTPTPCVPGDICNGSFESGSLSPWAATTGGPGQGDGVVISSGFFGGIAAKDGIYAWASAANGGTKDAQIYQQVAGVQPGKLCFVTAWTFTGGAGGADRPDNQSRLGIEDGALTAPGANVQWSEWVIDDSGWALMQAPTLIPQNSTVTIFLEFDQIGVDPTQVWNINRADFVEMIIFDPSSVPIWGHMR